jgi:hypothetical protein
VSRGPRITGTDEERLRTALQAVPVSGPLELCQPLHQGLASELRRAAGRGLVTIDEFPRGRGLPVVRFTLTDRGRAERAKGA